MPIYEFKCQDCGKVVERLCRPGEDAGTCPNCGSPSLKRMFSTFAAHGVEGGGAAGGSACGPCSGKSCATCK